LGVKESTVRYWRDMGMPYIKIGSKSFIPEPEFVEWAAQYLLIRNSSESNSNNNMEDAEED
jgi:hypothetical protein